MNKIVSIDYYIFYILLFSLPFGQRFFIPMLFIWFVFVFISYFLNNDYSIYKFRGLLFLPVLLFFFQTLRIVFSGNLMENLSDIQFKLPLLLIPMLYPYQRKLYKDNKHNFLWIFVVGCTAASLFYIGFALYRSYTFVNGLWVFNPIPQYGWNNYFFSVEFSYLMHPSYLALYLLVALLIMSSKLVLWWKNSIVLKVTTILISLMLVSCLVLLQSRAGMLNLGLISVVSFFYIIIAKRKFIIGIAFLVVLFCITLFIFSKFERIANTKRLFEIATEQGEKSQNREDVTFIRFGIWKSALSSIKEHPFLGVSPSNVREVLYEEYNKRDLIIAASEKLNAHNQYLETWLGLGIFGLLILLAMLFIPFWVGILRRDWLLVGFICLCSISFMFESMLERVAGIVFFTIFYTILVSRLNYNKIKIK
jgi:O-antigen ligase